MSQNALPFTFRRDDTVIAGHGETFITTTERVHGLLRLDRDTLVIQWRTARATQHLGMEIRTNREIDAVREVAVPLSALAGAAVRWVWFRWPPARYLVLTGADLRAFEAVAGKEGLGTDHPAELVLQVRRMDLPVAREFASDLSLAIAERALEDAHRPNPLPPRRPGDAS